ncbi:MAG TPA: LamG domain-containing protein [Anaerohalosphaeraceae bacterium]|nr:LamG domain-containing protein [Anaerohalosphaeraceae bacterium]
MKKIMYLLCVVLLAVFSDAETITVTDDPTGGGNSYGNCQGFAIDFDTTAPLAASSVTTGWNPPLVAGKSYALNSISIQYGGSVTVGNGSAVYLGIYTGGVNGGGFLGVSKNTVNFETTATDEWVTWEFENINVIVDSAVGSGTGLLYFRYQTSPTDGAINGIEISTRRLNYDAAMTQVLASIIAYGTLQGARAPHYKADIGSKDTPFMPHEPVVLPENLDGSSGTLQPNNADVQVTFSFKAAMNAEQTAVNPDVVGHYIYLTKGTSDPNLYLLDYVPHTDWNNPEVLYGPTTLVNGQGKTFKWKVEEAANDGSGNPSPVGDPNNIMGNEWTFTAVGANPQIISGPVHTLTDAAGNASLTITASSVANNFRWFKVVGVKDAAGGETDDIMLTDSGIYSGTTTPTLVITGAASNGSDDGQYYAVAYNGDPATPGVPSVSSPTAWLWYPRLVNHYPFETLTDGVSPDVVSGYNLTVLSNDIGTDVPVLDAGVPELGGSSLKFNNPRGTDPNTADAQYAQISYGWAGGYKDITISAWVYSSGGSNWNRILDFGNDTNNYMFLCINPGSVNRAVRFAVKVAGGTEQSVTSAAGAVPDNVWTYVTAVLSGNTARLYINGELVATNTNFTFDPVSYGPSTQNWLGRSQWGAGDGYFNGMIDELKIYNYARTTEQIAQDYLAVRGEWICNRELYNLPYDFNNDCIVDISDFAAFAATWLDSYRIYPD